MAKAIATEKLRSKAARLRASRQRHVHRLGTQPNAASFQAVKETRPPPTTAIPRPGGEGVGFTPNEKEKHNITAAAWAEVFNRFEWGTVPTYQAWKEEFGHLVQSFECQLPRLTGAQLKARLHKLASKEAPGADSWTVPEAAALPLSLIHI